MPNYIADRQVLWDKLKKQYDEEVAAKPRVAIKITLPDGKIIDGNSWDTTPYSVAAGISQGLADATVIAKVNGILWDLDRPLEGDCSLQLIKFDDPDGKAVFWHSSAHALGEAMERIYGGHLCYGPPIESGFYYDMHVEGDGVSLFQFQFVQKLVNVQVMQFGVKVTNRLSYSVALVLRFDIVCLSPFLDHQQ